MIGSSRIRLGGLSLLPRKVAGQVADLGTAGTEPVFTATTLAGSSPIVVSGSNVEIDISSFSTTFGHRPFKASPEAWSNSVTTRREESER